MNTVFSLIYFECEKSPFNLSSAIVRPELFSSHSAALDKLFLYVENRLTDGLEDLFYQYIENNEALMDVLEQYVLENNDSLNVMDYIRSNKVEKWSLISFYFEQMNDELCHAEFRIEELPASSLLEQILGADALEIDDNFIRHFNILNSDDETDYPEDMPPTKESVYIEASYVSDDYVMFEYEFTREEIMNATYDINRKHWVIKNEFEYFVKAINFA